MAKTLREKYIEALTAEGYTKVPSRSGKYVMFKRTENTFFYIGKSGSLRFGANIATSISVSDKHKAFLLVRFAADAIVVQSP